MGFSHRFHRFHRFSQRLVKLVIISLSVAARRSLAAVIRHHLGWDAFFAIISCVGNQPERLNAEGEARVLLAGGKR